MRQNSARNAPLFSVLSNRAFRAIWYVGSLHEISRRMELLVLSWLILQTTNSPFLLLLVLVLNNVPRPFFSPFSGLIADRFSRLKIMIAAQIINTAMSAVLFLLVFTDSIASWHVFTAVLLSGITKSLEDPSRRTAILDIVGERRLVNALSLDTISNTSGKMIGPLVGGILVDTTGFIGAFLVMLTFHLLTLLMLLRVRIPRVVRPLAAEPIWRSLGDGARFALRHPLLWGMLYITIFMNALAFPLQQFIPAIGRDNLQVGATLVGLLVAGEGLGQLIGASVMALTRNLRHHGRVFVIGSAVVLLMGILFVWTPWYSVAFLLLMLGGMGQSGFGTMQSTITLLGTPVEMRGRMVGLMSFCIGLGWVASLEVGVVAELFGTQMAITVNAALGLLLLLPAVLLTPLVRRPPAVVELAPEPESPR